VRRRLGYPEPEPVDLAGLGNVRIEALDVVVTPEAVASVLPLSSTITRFAQVSLSRQR